MTLYINDNSQGISLEQFDHNIRYEDGRQENFIFTLSVTENISTIADQYENSPVTSFVVRNENGDILSQLNNINLKLDSLTDSIFERSHSIFMTLINT